MTTILVEGVDDLEVIRHLLHSRGFVLDQQSKLLKHSQFGELLVKKTQDPYDDGGAQTLIRKFALLLKTTNPAVGIVLDRDLDLPRQLRPWPSLRHHILEVLPDLKLILPKEGGPLPAEGLIIPFGRGRRLGVWLMPDNQNLGMLETFVKKLIPPDDRLLSRAESVVRAIPEEDRRFRHKKDKACIHTWLAWQEEPGIGMGTAIRSLYLRADAPAATLFVKWLEQLVTRA